MNITPIEMQVIIPKATEVGKGQQQRDQQNVFQQQFGAAELQQKAEHKLKQVQTTEKSEGQKIKKDSKKKKNKDQGGASGSQKEQVDEDDVVMAVDTFRGRNIDIKF